MLNNQLHKADSIDSLRTALNIKKSPGFWTWRIISMITRACHFVLIYIAIECAHILSPHVFQIHFKPLMLELNPSAQWCLTRFFTGDFASRTVHFINICKKNQQMQQLFIQFINYVWYLLHVSAFHCHPQGAFLVPSERCSIEEQSIEYCGL
jgi:hypothetical protein